MDERDVREQSRETKKDAEELERMMALPGWKVLQKLINVVGQNYLQQVLAPSTDRDGVMKAEFAKGTLNGLQLAVSLASAKVNEANNLSSVTED